MNLKTVLVVGTTIAILAVVAMIMGWGDQNDVMVAIGVTLGVAMSIPTSIMIVVVERATRRRETGYYDRETHVHNHDNRTIYLVQRDGTWEQVSEMQGKLLLEG